MQPLLIISSKSPYNSSFAQEALDAALAASVFAETRLLFIRDGVWQLVKHQQGTDAGRKTFTDGFAALPHYGISDVYVCRQSLRKRGLAAEDLMIEAESADRTSIQQLLLNHRILAF